MNDDRTVSADAMRARMAPPPRQRKEERPRDHGQGQPSFCRGRFAAGADGMSVARSSSAFPMRCRMTPTSSTFLRTARLSRRTGRRPAQGGDLETGHWPLRRGLTGKTVAVTDAPGHLVRFAPLPGRARGLAGMPDLLGGLEFGALIGDGALDADWLVGEVGRRDVPWR